jgi:hypothetical protein
MKVTMLNLAMAALLLIASRVSALEKEKDDAGEAGKHHPRPVSQLVERIKKFVLSVEQKTKLAALEKEYAPKIREAKAKADLDSVLTDNQKKARDAAQKAAEDAGKDRKEIKQAGKTAVKLTKEQKKKLAAAKKDATTLRREFEDKVISLLTPEQKELLDKEARERRKRRAE